MNKKKVLISQPMRGLSTEQIKANNVKNKPLYCLAKSVKLIAEEADAVYFMKGWSKLEDVL